MMNRYLPHSGFVAFFWWMTALSVFFSATAQVKERVRTYDVLHYALDIAIDEQEDKVAGTVSIRLVPLSSISSLQLDAGPMEIRSVRQTQSPSHSVRLKHKLLGKSLQVFLPQTISQRDTLELAITYSCQPKAGLYFIHPDDGYPSRPVQVWSQGEEELNHFWFPCYDYPNDKATVDMRVTVNDKYMAISNGALVEQTHDTLNHRRTFFWYSPKPFSSYLISLVVGTYAQTEQWYKNIPVQYFVYPEQQQDALRSFGKTVDMMEFYAGRIGTDYPWQKYAQTVVSEFMYGGMENASAATLTDKTIHSRQAHLDVSSDGLIAHELAHQWFGDLLTCRSWADAWLNEGFASYFELLYTEKEKGWDEFQYAMFENQRALVGSDTGSARRPTVTEHYVEPSELFDSHIYSRGACLLHMLRFVLGDEVFWQGIRRYVSLFQYENVTTQDFQRALEQVSGQQLGWFFDQWVTKAGYPVLEVAPMYEVHSGMLTVRVMQAQRIDSLTPLYRMPMAISVTIPSGTQVRRVLLEAIPDQSFAFPVDAEPLNVVCNAGGWLLADVHQHRSTEQLLYQLHHGDVLQRWSALQDLVPLVDKADIRKEVARALVADQFWAIRRKAAEVLATAADSTVITDLAPAFKDPEAKVRVAATRSLRSFKTLDALIALGNTVDTDSSYAVVAEAIGGLVAIDPANGMSYCEKGLSLDSYNDIIRTSAISALGSLKTPAALCKLLAFTENGHSKEVRLTAMDALADYWPSDAGVRERLEELVNNPMQSVRRKALERLGKIADPDLRGLFEEVLKKTYDEQLRREARKALSLIDRVPAH